MKNTYLKKTIFFLSFLLFITACSDSDENVPDEGTNPPPSGVNTSLNKKPLGESANDLLSDTKFDKIVIDVMYVDNNKPTTAAMDNFKSFLQQRLHKSSITINQRSIGSGTKEIYTINDIIALEDDNRVSYNENSTIAVSALFVNGEYSENTENGKVLGVAYRNTSFVLFEETIKSFSSGVLAPSLSTLESVVINHEFGHILGLVNVGTPMQVNHQDTAHGKHCDNEDCLMFWTAETGEGLVNMISGGSVPDLDTNCINDLQANGGK